MKFLTSLIYYKFITFINILQIFIITNTIFKKKYILFIKLLKIYLVNIFLIYYYIIFFIFSNMKYFF